MNLVDRARNMLTTPKTEWMVVASETPDNSKIIVGYVLPLAVAGAVATFIGYTLFGYGARFGILQWVLWRAVIVFAQMVLSIYLAAFVVDALAPTFKAEKNFGRSLQLVAYGSTPSLVAMLLNIVPVVGGLAAIAGGIYSIYLFYLGLPPVKKAPPEQAAGYLVVCFVVLLVVYMIVGAILARILLAGFYTSFWY